LKGQAPSMALFRAIAKDAQSRIEPTEDIHASADYRHDLVGAVVERALAEAAGVEGEAAR